MKFELKENDEKSLENHLKSAGVIDEEVSITDLAKAGDGNMNLTLRAETEKTNFIIKQANPFVQKYPSIAAPVERAKMEFTFYTEARKLDGVKDYLPFPYHFDDKNHLLVLEDLGKKGDYTRYYRSDLTLPPEVVKDLLHFLKLLHGAELKKKSIENKEMRKLNHTHIFDFPFRSDNGLDLNEIQRGLRNLAEEFIFSNEKLRTIAEKLGEKYLSATGPSLLHGDFFPGSWLDSSEGVKVIDPEFCFTGPAEFDLGVFKAHLIFCGMSDRGIKTLFRRYGDFDAELANQFAGIEILRRIFGMAQLPLERSINEKGTLTRKALKLLDL